MERYTDGRMGRCADVHINRPGCIATHRHLRICSGGWKCALVGVPWRGSVSACLAWGDLFVNNVFMKVLKRLSLLRHHGAPMMAHLQLPDIRCFQYHKFETQQIQTPLPTGLRERGKSGRAPHLCDECREKPLRHLL